MNIYGVSLAGRARGRVKALQNLAFPATVLSVGDAGDAAGDFEASQAVVVSKRLFLRASSRDCYQYTAGTGAPASEPGVKVTVMCR